MIIDRLRRAKAAFSGMAVIPDNAILLPKPTAPDTGWFLLTIAEFKSVVLERARAVWMRETIGNPRKRGKFEESAQYRTAMVTIRNAVNGTDTKNG